MTEIERLIWVTAKAKYFCAHGLTNIWGDLPVGQARSLQSRAGVHGE
jgi:hypothetical protein